MHRIAVLTALALVSALAVPSGVMAQQPAQPVQVFVDGQPVYFDVPPMLTQGRVFVPLRGVFERLGATVDYNPETQHILAVRGAETTELTIGSQRAIVNGNPTLLDVPAFTVGGRTMVPLRFVSESLGATVQWIDAERTIVISTTGAAVPIPQQTPPPAAVPVPAPQAQTLNGRLMAVTPGGAPQIVVRTGGQDYTIPVLPDTAIFRVDAQTNAGGSAPLASLRPGDQVTVVLNGRGEARRVTATYRFTPGGRIATVNRANRTVTLAGGQTFVVLRDAEITLNGQAADWGALRNGEFARFLLIEGTNQAYAVHATSGSASVPPVSIALPRIASPHDGDTIGSTFTVRGTAQPGSVIIVKAQPRLLGETRQVQTAADADGHWSAAFDLATLPFVNFPYVLSAVEIVNGVESDPTSIQINVR